MDKKTFIAQVSSWVFHFGFSSEVSLFIASQFALESDFGTSNLALKYHNYCGMRCPMVRISTAVNAGDGQCTWASYSNLHDCVTDFILCLQYHRPFSEIKDNIAAYCRFISRFYCPERDYISKINTIYSQFKIYKNER